MAPGGVTTPSPQPRALQAGVTLLSPRCHQPGSPRIRAPPRSDARAGISERGINKSPAGSPPLFIAAPSPPLQLLRGSAAAPGTGGAGGPLVPALPPRSHSRGAGGCCSPAMECPDACPCRGRCCQSLLSPPEGPAPPWWHPQLSLVRCPRMGGGRATRGCPNAVSHPGAGTLVAVAQRHVVTVDLPYPHPHPRLGDDGDRQDHSAHAAISQGIP